MFTEALWRGNLEAIRKSPKADLHNHFVLGGSRKYLLKQSGRNIQPIMNPLHSMEEMHAWNAANIGHFFDTPNGRRMLIKAAFMQAKEDGVTILEIGEDVWGLGAFFNEHIDELVDAFETAHKEIAPEIELRLQIGLSRHCKIDYLEDCLSHFWGCKAFYSIDLYGDELAQPIENFIPIYRRAKIEGLRLKAHVGEWGTADDVRRAVECLELDEVQHGIAAAKDASVIRFLADNRIRLNKPDFYRSFLPELGIPEMSHNGMLPRYHSREEQCDRFLHHTDSDDRCDRFPVRRKHFSEKPDLLIHPTSRLQSRTGGRNDRFLPRNK